MGKLTAERDKAKGLAEQVSGDVKKAIGRTFKDKELEAEGIVEREKGLAREAIGEGKRKLADLGEEP